LVQQYVTNAVHRSDVSRIIDARPVH